MGWMESPPAYRPRRREPGRPGAAVGIVLLTLVVTAVVGGCSLVAAFGKGLGCAYTSTHEDCGGPEFVIGLILGSACLIGGLIWAVRVGRGRIIPDEPGVPIWDSSKRCHVGRLGAQLRDQPAGHVVGWLPPGLVVAEQERRHLQAGELQGEWVRVHGAGMAAGWVPADMLEPLGRPASSTGPPPSERGVGGSSE